MTRKDYVKFAEMLRQKRQLIEDSSSTLLDLTISIADIFAQDNPKFDREKFYAACEPKKD
jgi:hypothetical protein